MGFRMFPRCRARYELSSFRRENLLRLRRYINEVVVDQLPPLTNLHRALEASKRVNSP